MHCIDFMLQLNQRHNQRQHQRHNFKLVFNRKNITLLVKQLFYLGVFILNSKKITVDHLHNFLVVCKEQLPLVMELVDSVVKGTRNLKPERKSDIAL